MIGGAEVLRTPELAAKRLVLRSGAQLILQAIGSATGDNPTLFIIVADEVDVAGPAMITWARDDRIRLPPPERGKAPNGSAGRGDSADGEAGSDGDTGTVGYRGASAPSLIIITRKLSGSGTLFVDLRGQEGGPGGKGQDGGDGGPGARGRPAALSPFDCSRGPGQGGNGGPGGKAGSGGIGGTGGDGGSIFLITIDPAATAKYMKALLGGGRGGGPGPSGAHGTGGRGAPEGVSKPPFCRSAGRDGADGRTLRTPLQDAKAGADGVDGKFWPALVTEERITRLFMPAPSAPMQSPVAPR